MVFSNLRGYFFVNKIKINIYHLLKKDYFTYIIVLYIWAPVAALYDATRNNYIRFFDKYSQSTSKLLIN